MGYWLRDSTAGVPVISVELLHAQHHQTHSDTGTQHCRWQSCMMLYVVWQSWHQLMDLIWSIQTSQSLVVGFLLPNLSGKRSIWILLLPEVVAAVYIKAFPSRQRRGAVLSDLKTNRLGANINCGATQGIHWRYCPMKMGWAIPSIHMLHPVLTVNSKDWTSYRSWAISGKDAKTRMKAYKWRFPGQQHQVVSPGDVSFLYRV